jgi:hypothetical protein
MKRSINNCQTNVSIRYYKLRRPERGVFFCATSDVGWAGSKVEGGYRFGFQGAMILGKKLPPCQVRHNRGGNWNILLKSLNLKQIFSVSGSPAISDGERHIHLGLFGVVSAPRNHTA